MSNTNNEDNRTIDEPVVETYTMTDDDGEYEVEITYGDEPWQEVFSRILRHHYIEK